MQRKKVFISSVQTEFRFERQLLFDYLISDVLLGKFFEPFIFEKLPAVSKNSETVYLNEVKECDIYLGIFGSKYGFEDADGISPTEKEYDLAEKFHKIRLIYIKETEKREEKEDLLIKKAEKDIVRKKFSDCDELKTIVYISLIRYLEENEYIRVSPIDATINKNASLEDIDEEKVKKFISKARIKRNFPYDENDNINNVLEHLGLIENNNITNAAILLFGKKPQKYFITSSIKCSQFYGNKIEKPIPSYHIYDGDVFELIDQAVSFVMSRIDATVGDRDKSFQADVTSELPLQAVTEAIVNAVCHRDYTSNASVQVMLFKNRLEIWNPGNLPYGLTIDMLKSHHTSMPSNPLLARPMYLFGSIEQMGTGTEMIINKCIEYGLPVPEFQQSEIFKLIIWRKVVNSSSNDVLTSQATMQPTMQPTMQVQKLLEKFDGEMSMAEILKILKMNNRDYVRLNYIQPALKQGLIELVYPDNPNHPQQKYRLARKRNKK